MARQVLISYLEAWVESPYDSGGLFFIPRVLSSFWHGLSRHVQELDLIPSDKLEPPPALLPIPVIVLTVLPFTPCLRDRPGHLDPYRPTWAQLRSHQAEADALRRLQPALVEPSY